MGSGGDVFYMPLPIHELSVPFSRLGGLTRNQNSSISNSAFAFKDHKEKKNTNSLLIFIFGCCLSFYVDPFYFKMKMYSQFLDDSCDTVKRIFFKKNASPF